MLSKSKIKYIQSLGHKKFRDKESVFIAEGPKIISELLAVMPENIITVYAVKDWLAENNQLLKNAEYLEVDEAELERISQSSTPNQVLAVLKKIGHPEIHTGGTITLVLDTIQDPGNLGTIVRSADWFGVKQVVCSEECADIYNSKVVQSTMGSIARVAVFYTALVPWIKKQSVRVYATSLEGKEIGKVGELSEAIIIIGNESKGISPDLLQLADEKITIPRKGKAESLNAAVAAGIILSHLVL